MRGLEYLDLIDEDAEIENFVKFSEVKRTKMKDEERQFKNKKKNKGKVKSNKK